MESVCLPTKSFAATFLSLGVNQWFSIAKGIEIIGFAMQLLKNFALFNICSIIHIVLVVCTD